MNYLLFERDSFNSLYNCSILPDEKWQTYKRPNVVIGAIYIVIGAIYQVNFLILRMDVL